MNCSNAYRRKVRKQLPYGSFDASYTPRTTTPNNIPTDKEDLYAQNLRLKKTTNQLKKEITQHRVRLASRDDEWTMKVRLLQKCTNLKQIQQILGQDLAQLRKKNRDLQNQVEFLREELAALNKNTKVSHLMQLQGQIAALKEENEKLMFQIKLMSKYSADQVEQAQKSFEYQALSHIAALRIQKLTKKNQQYSRQVSYLKQQNSKMRVKLCQFESQIDSLHTLRIKQKQNDQSIIKKPQSQQLSNKLKEKLRKAEKKIENLQKIVKDKDQKSISQSNKSVNHLIEDQVLNKVEINLPTSRQLTLSRLEYLDNPLQKKNNKVRKNPLKVSFEDLLNIGIDLLKNLESNGLSPNQIRKFSLQQQGKLSNFQQIMAILSESPFNIEDQQSCLLLSRYLTQNPPDTTIIWVQLRKNFPLKTFWISFSNFLRDCQIRQQEDLQHQMIKARRFAVLNEPLIRQTIRQCKEKSDKLYVVPEYQLKDLLQALDDLDASNRYSGAIQRVRQKIQSNMIVSWEEFIELFRVQDKEKRRRSRQ